MSWGGGGVSSPNPAQPATEAVSRLGDAFGSAFGSTFGSPSRGGGDRSPRGGGDSSPRARVLTTKERLALAALEELDLEQRVLVGAHAPDRATLMSLKQPPQSGHGRMPSQLKCLARLMVSTGGPLVERCLAMETGDHAGDDGVGGGEPEDLEEDGSDATRSRPAAEISIGNPLHKICAILEAVWLSNGVTVFKEGDEGTHIFLVLSGTLEVTRSETGPNGLKMPRHLCYVKAGGFFGELALLKANLMRHATVTTTEDCLLARMAASDLLEQDIDVDLFTNFDLDENDVDEPSKLRAAKSATTRENRRDGSDDYQIVNILEKKPLLRTEDEVDIVVRNICDRNDFFNGIQSASQKKALCRGMTAVFHEPKSVVVHQGDPGNEMYIILSGSVNVITRAGGDTVEWSASDDSDQWRHEVFLTAGAHFGEVALFHPDNRRNATIYAREDTTLLVLTREVYTKTLRRNQEAHTVKKVVQLQSIAIFQDYTVEELLRLSHDCTTLHLSKGDVITNSSDAERPSTSDGQKKSRAREAHAAHAIEVRHRHIFFLLQGTAVMSMHGVRPPLMACNGHESSGPRNVRCCALSPGAIMALYAIPGLAAICGPAATSPIVYTAVSEAIVVRFDVSALVRRAHKSTTSLLEELARKELTLPSVKGLVSTELNWQRFRDGVVPVQRHIEAREPWVPQSPSSPHRSIGSSPRTRPSPRARRVRSQSNFSPMPFSPNNPTATMPRHRTPGHMSSPSSSSSFGTPANKSTRRPHSGPVDNTSHAQPSFGLGRERVAPVPEGRNEGVEEIDDPFQHIMALGLTNCEEVVRAALELKENNVEAAIQLISKGGRAAKERGSPSSSALVDELSDRLDVVIGLRATQRGRLSPTPPEIAALPAEVLRRSLDESRWDPLVRMAASSMRTSQGESSDEHEKLSSTPKTPRNQTSELDLGDNPIVDVTKRISNKWGNGCLYSEMLYGVTMLHVALSPEDSSSPGEPARRHDSAASLHWLSHVDSLLRRFDHQANMCGLMHGSSRLPPRTQHDAPQLCADTCTWRVWCRPGV